MGNRPITRRQLLAYSGGALATAALAGCGGSGGSSGGKTQIVLWSSYSGVLGKTLKKLVDDFNKSQSDIVLKNQYQGSYEDTAAKLASALVAQKGPDFATLSDVTWNKFYLNQTIAPMDDYFGGDFKPDVYVKPLIDAGTRVNHVWWTPFARSTPLFYYNKNMFEKAGLPDRGPKTWSELREWGPELQKLSGHPLAHVFATTENYNTWTFQGNEWEWEGNYSRDNLKEISIAEPNSVAAGEFARKFIHEDKLGKVSANNDTDFFNGQAATATLSTGSLVTALQSAKFDVGVSFLPEQKKFGCPLGGAGLCLMNNASDDKKQAAFEFIKFAAKPENAAYWSQHTGYMPVTQASIDSSQMQKYFKKNPNFHVAVQQLPKTEPQDLARVMVPNGQEMIGDALEQIMIKNEPTEQVFGSVKSKLEKAAKEALDQLAKIHG